MEVKAYRSELSLKNKIARQLWAVVYLLFFRFSPRMCHFWRGYLLRCFGANVSKTAKVYSSVRVWAPWNLTIEDGVIVGDRVDCYCVAPIFIGKRSVVSQDSCLCAATHDHKSESFDLIPKPIVIESGAWVAARAFIGPGVTVSERAVVGACAVVFKDVAAGAVMIGNPAKMLERVNQGSV